MKYFGNLREPFNGLPPALRQYLTAVWQREMRTAPDITDDAWHQALHILSSQGMSALFYDHLKQAAPTVCPPSWVMKKLKSAFLSGMAGLLHGEHQLCRISQAFEKQGISFLVLKGLALGATLYPSPALRPFSDMDLLVPEKAYPDARNILLTTGYTLKNDRYPKLRRLHSDETFVPGKEAGHFPVELHWRLDHLYGINRHIDYGELFDDAATFQAGHLKVKKLSFIDDLIFSAQHLTEHHTHEMRLIWIHDICQMLKQGLTEHQVDELKEKCLKRRMTLCVSTAVHLASSWSDSLPPHWLTGLTPDTEEMEGWQRLMNRHRTLYHYLKCRLPSPLSPTEALQMIAYFLIPSPGHLKDIYRIKNDLTLPLFYVKRLLDVSRGRIMRP